LLEELALAPLERLAVLGLAPRLLLPLDRVEALGLAPRLLALAPPRDRCWALDWRAEDEAPRVVPPYLLAVALLEYGKGARYAFSRPVPGARIDGDSAPELCGRRGEGAGVACSLALAPPCGLSRGVSLCHHLPPTSARLTVPTARSA